MPLGSRSVPSVGPIGPAGRSRRGPALRKRRRPIMPKTCEGGVDLAAGTGVENLDLQPDGAGGWFYGPQGRLGIRNIGRIDEHSNAFGPGHERTQQFQALCRQLGIEKIDSRQIAIRSSEARDKTKSDRVV